MFGREQKCLAGLVWRTVDRGQWLRSHQQHARRGIGFTKPAQQPLQQQQQQQQQQQPLRRLPLLLRHGWSQFWQQRRFHGETHSGAGPGQALQSWHAAAAAVTAAVVLGLSVAAHSSQFASERTAFALDSVAHARLRRTVYGWARPGHNYQTDPAVNRANTAVMLISDVDETMTGNNESLDAFNEWWLKEQVPRNSCLVYNTARPCGYEGFSRSKSGFTHLVQSGRFDLMRPDVLITCEGTEVFWLDANSNTPAQRDMEWHEHLAEFWNQDVVEKRLLQHDEGLTGDLGVTGPFNSDDTFRVAITVADKQRAIDIADRVQGDLGPHYNVFWTEAWVRGIYLVSVLPSGAGKGNAAEHVAGKVGIGLDRTVWAGDSDNDLQMLKTHALRGIVVGNSFSERLRAAASEDTRARFYQAQASHAAGVLEGLAFIYPELLKESKTPAVSASS